MPAATMAGTLAVVLSGAMTSDLFIDLLLLCMQYGGTG